MLLLTLEEAWQPHPRTLLTLEAEGMIPLDKVGNSIVLLMLRDTLTSHQALVHVGSKLPFIISNFLHSTSK